MNYDRPDYFKRVRYSFWMRQNHPGMSEAAYPFDPGVLYPDAPPQVEEALKRIDPEAPLKTTFMLRELEHSFEQEISILKDARTTILKMLAYQFDRRTVRLHRKGTTIPGTYKSKFQEDQVRVTYGSYSAEHHTAYLVDDSKIVEVAQGRFTSAVKPSAQFVKVESPTGKRFLVRNQLLIKDWAILGPTVEQEAMCKDATILV